MTKDGFMLLSHVSTLLHAARDDIRLVVDACPKQRFTIRVVGEVEMIVRSSLLLCPIKLPPHSHFPKRANQGHTIKGLLDDTRMLTRIEKALPFIVHGTSEEAWTSIQLGGLLPMRRNHVHMATHTSKVRANSKVLVCVDMEAAMCDGATFFMSENGVVLSSGAIAPRFLSRLFMPDTAASATV